MKQSLLFVPTLKDAPSDAEVKSHKLMTRAGLIKQVAAGIYSYLPLGYRVIKKIEKIIREELDKIGASELLLPALQPRDLWDESGRWDKYGPELMRLKDRKDRDFCLGPTHEEVITQVVRDYLNSYKKLPLALYQIQTKFRDEMRPRFGLMRGREFIMKDAYTFTETEADLDTWYQKFSDAYTAIFKRCGLKTRIVSSDVGQIGGDEADEFMVMSEVGEDLITYCTDCDYAANQDHSKLNDGDDCPVCGGTITTAQGIEVGNIFKLGTKYSESMNAKVINEDGQHIPVIMGCYGIGISRTLMASVEQHATDKGLLWPDEITPFHIHILPINVNNETHMTLANTLYTSLKEKGIEVLIDDRKERAGSKFKDSDLMGIPYRIVVGKDAKNGQVEFTNRYESETSLKTIEDILDFF
ncbi:MAG: proline--tRNA ligase [Candidatus Izimaplasma sp.]|nr:proline--tRNA ligase [Candidatus Izimaplasma bacterium]